MKKLFLTVIAVAFLAGSLSACGKKGSPKYKAFNPDQTINVDAA